MIKDTSAQDTAITSKKRRLKPIALGAAVLIAVALSAHAIITAETVSQSVDKSSLQIATVKRGELVRDIAATGRIVAANAPQVYSPEQGLATLMVRAGDAVKEGQVVAEVKSPELENNLQQEKSEALRLEGEFEQQKLETRRQTLLLNKQLDLAKVELQAAERENRRAHASIEGHLISQIDFEKAEDDLARARLNVAHAEQEVELAKDALAFALQSAQSALNRQRFVVSELERKITNLAVTASVSGVVGNLLVAPKSVVSVNQPLMTLVDLSAYEAEVNVAESYANNIGIGMDVELTIGARKVIGTLSAISPEVTEREVTTRVRFSQDALSQIRQNQQISARILLENKDDVVKVRRGSFLDAGGFVAYKLDGDVARRIDIETGVTSMREVEILSGLQPGEQIIVSGYQKFQQAPSVLLR